MEEKGLERGILYRLPADVYCFMFKYWETEALNSGSCAVLETHRNTFLIRVVPTFGQSNSVIRTGNIVTLGSFSPHLKL